MTAHEEVEVKLQTF